VEQIFDKTAAAAFGLATNQVILMIHSGSRGLGYQIAADYIRVAQDDSSARGERLADRQLAFLYNDSKLGQDYLGAMACGMNYAWANRSGLAYFVRKAWERIVNDEPLPMLYDISHNTAKLETHRVDGAERNLLVHRKGATRAFPPNHPAVPDVFKPVGQPVFIPGSMGTASYILIVTEHAMGETFGSVCHGAGRIMSRKQAVSQFQGKTLKESLKMKNILVRTYSMRGLAEEAPLAYKDVDNVVSVVERAGLAKRVARLRPIIVIKGD
jgi:tRNA-splicing ligase RtcB